MSTTTPTQETVSTDEPTTTDRTREGLATIVAQAVPIGDDLPDFDEFRAVCAFTQDSIEAAAGGEL